jgi:hypothetical protein
VRAREDGGVCAGKSCLGLRRWYESELVKRRRREVAEVGMKLRKVIADLFLEGGKGDLNFARDT